ncbi:delta-60 repeat domain-containing protein [Desulfonatronum sp. SC1]|uniref:InlB B-repeat-containing protein n=1 Tax=Desulfonatronum sp. SC1 TaxID=2109626 RepID=UPI000D31D5A9|nr:delta-60 repeat domain-containing protein [Desulfonatronum sp. SC1]PTN33783.1 hypothetical protein C6366_13925 [Desulfonatronum sp. SC1]
MMKARLIAGFLFVLIVQIHLGIAPVCAQSALDGFHPNADGTVRALAVQSDGKILVGGDFTTIAGTGRNRIARLHADGSLDTAFNPGTGATATVQSIAVQSDGKVLVGGDFTSYNGTSRNRIARLNTDGSLDPSFNPGSGVEPPDSAVYALAIQSDGKVVIGGLFTTVGGITRNNIARLNIDGSLDPTFNPGTGTDALIWDLTVQSDGKVLVGGNFTTYNGTSRNRIVRLHADGSLDPTFNPGSGVEGTSVYSLGLQADGKVLIGGTFSAYNGTPRQSIARLTSSGSLDTSFTAGSSGTVYELKIQPDGATLVGGIFTQLVGQDRSNMGRLLPDGSIDPDFDPGVGVVGDFVWALETQPDGQILVGGLFTTLGGQARGNIGRLYPDGTLDADCNPNADNQVSALAVQPDGKILMGGLFTTVGGTGRNRIARLYPDGTLDAAFDIGSGFDGLVRSLAVQPDGKILAAGAFTEYNGTGRKYMARLHADGSLDTSFASTGSGLNNAVSSLALQPDGKVLVGGDFTSYNGTDRKYMARLHADGSLDTTFASTGTGLDDIVSSLALQPDGKVLVGGDFTSYNDTGRKYMARLHADGSLDTAFVPATISGNRVYALALLPDGTVCMAGDFFEVGSVSRDKIARLGAGGVLDQTFFPGTGANNLIYTLVLDADGKVLIGGDFSTYNGTDRSRIARVNGDGSLDTTFIPQGTTNGSIRALALQVDGKVLAGGWFTSLAGQNRNRIGRLSVAGAVLQSLDASGDGASMTWTRSGAGPEFFRVTFEQSLDGTSYNLLGSGTRVAGGWQLSGLSLPKAQNFWIRARGYHASGEYTASQSMAESVGNFFLAGSLRVNIEPQGARQAGAGWRRVGTSDNWRGSGTTEYGLPVGQHGVTFKRVAGWNTKADENVTILSGQSTTLSVTYTSNTTQYQVSLAAGDNNGSVAGGGTFVHNTWVTVRAIPKKGYAFSHWTLNGQKISGAGATYSFYATSNCSLVAHFRDSIPLPGLLMLLLDE